MHRTFTTATRRRIITVVALCLLAGACGDLVEIRPLDDLVLDQPGRPTVITDAQGSPLATLRGGRLATPVALSEVAPPVVAAVIAVEDVRFRDHGGVDARALVRALTRNVREAQVLEGGSTITQQLAKNTVTGDARTVERKLVEASVALQLEQQMSKDEILERYLNTVYFGNGAYGIEAAAREYFGLPAGGLDLHRAALLAGLLRSPATYDPRRHPDAAVRRRDLVLDLMADHGLISDAQARRAAARSLDVAAPRRHAWRAAYFVDHVLAQLQHGEEFAVLGDTPQARAARVFDGDLRIETTLEPRWQEAAEAAITATTPRDDDPDAALVAIDPATGGIRALVGGRDYFADADVARFNLATDALRQPGSTFKPIVLAAALQAGGALDDRYDAPAELRLPPGPGEGGPWRVTNYGDRGFPRMDLRTATALSVNVVYAQLVEEVGAAAVADMARALGVRTPLTPLRSLALGAGEVSVLDMASVQATLAAGGVHRPPTAVTRITTTDGDVLYTRPPPRGERVLEQRYALQVTAALREVVENGTGVRAAAHRPLAGKTGTTQAGADAWFAGYTPDMAAAVWIGFHEGRVPMRPPRTRTSVEGGTWPAEAFARFTLRALQDVPANDFTVRVPDVTGETSPVAQRRLTRAGFDVSVARRYSSRLPPGLTVEQRPAAGDAVTLPVGARATVTVTSNEAEPVAVPDVLGTTRGEAEAVVGAAGLVARVERVCPGGTPTCTGAVERPGRTWEQAPEAGSTATTGDAVTIRVFPQAR
ncbi:MAG TPA: transglycosylase domain-containing protein [Euzebyales bacterium]|nr:transglycosylase domain-containing protein [Euzebyales bacterium]